MLDKIFNIKKPYFAITYFFALFLDLWVKLNLELFPYRYITKTLIMVLLIVFYLRNRNVTNKCNHRFTLLALAFFLIASIVVINHLNSYCFIIGMVFFALAKIMCCFRFSNSRDFSIIRLLPFFTFSFAIMVFVFMLIYSNLKSFFIPVLIYFFISLLLCLFANLRKNDVNNRSYNYVIMAMVFLILSEVIMAIKTYYMSIPFEDILVMLFYGISQFLIVYGIIIEVKLKGEEEFALV